jgi:TRAP-type uncharacterized transport system substrate-binding protein
MRLRLPRPMTILIAGVLLLAPAVIAAVYFFRPHVTLRLTSGAAGGAAERFISAFIKVSSVQHPRVHFDTVQVTDLMSSAKALEDGKVDLAIVRSDVAPTNGQTIAILRRDVVAFVVPPNSAVDKVASLDGKTIGIPAGPQQEYNAQALDTILSYYNIAPKSVKRVVLPLAEIGQAVHQKHVGAKWSMS